MLVMTAQAIQEIFFTVVKKQIKTLVSMTSLTYHGGMKQLNDLYQRLAKIENLSRFCRIYNLNYRTVQRLRAHQGRPTWATFDKVIKALDKEGK